MEKAKRATALLNRPVIRLGPDIDQIADEAEEALIASELPIYQRAGCLVKPGFLPVESAHGGETIAAALKVLKAPSLRDQLSKAADFEKWDGRKKTWARCYPPSEVADIILSRAGEWRFPTIVGITTTPTMRPDGSLLTREGYDQSTRLYHVPDPSLVLPVIPDRPSKAQALEAIKLMDRLLDGFPFKGLVDRAVALAAILTVVGRGGLKVAPLFCFSANEPGSGKSYLCDLVSTFVTGRWCPVIAAGSDEELDKRLDGLLLAALPVVAVDNVVGTLSSTSRLNQAVERPLIGIRLFGSQDIVTVETRITFLANGNNLTIRGDAVRRVLRSILNAQMERPETRTFGFDPIKLAVSDRGRYVAAALTVLRAYQVSEHECGDLEPLQSYGGWSAIVREALVWLGYADPAHSMIALRDEDPERTSMRSVFAAWHAMFSDTPMSVAAVLEVIRPREQQNDTSKNGEDKIAVDDLRQALMAVAVMRGNVDATRLGVWLRQNKDRQSSGYLLSAEAKTRDHTNQWRVQRLDGAPAPRKAPYTEREHMAFRARMAEARQRRAEGGDGDRSP